MSVPERRSPVYGPVDSWRFGKSLGIDPIVVESVCSFRCIYCQLGTIDVVTGERRVFIPTSTLMTHLAASRWREADVVSFSGSGEPTLARNLGSMVAAAHDMTGKRIVVLTNGTLLGQERVRRDLALADEVCCKLDAVSDASRARINRPLPGMTLGRLIEGIERFRSEHRAALSIQIMFLPSTPREISNLAGLLTRIAPDQTYVSIPSRHAAGPWEIGRRGDHRPLGSGARTEKLDDFVEALRRMSGLRVSSAGNRQP